jgi:predicted TIM-barrel fold metal-dependent hydrolase
MAEWVDVHTHVLHSKVAAKVLAQLEAHYHLRPMGNGQAEQLLQCMEWCDVSKAFVHTAAISAEQVNPANRWAVSLKRYPQFVPFGTMHPQLKDFESELAWLFDHGIRGVKLHPDYQGFRLDDPALLPIFAAMEGSFTVMVHVGGLLPPEQSPSCPWKLAAIKRRFPKLQLIAAHFGGYLHWQHVVEAYRGLDILLDTSSTLFTIPQPLLEAIFHAFPRHNFLYGSDYPFWEPTMERNSLQRRLHLSDSELDEIMSAGSRLGLY